MRTHQETRDLSWKERHVASDRRHKIEKHTTNVPSVRSGPQGRKKVSPIERRRDKSRTDPKLEMGKGYRTSPRSNEVANQPVRSTKKKSTHITSSQGPQNVPHFFSKPLSPVIRAPKRPPRSSSPLPWTPAGLATLPSRSSRSTGPGSYDASRGCLPKRSRPMINRLLSSLNDDIPPLHAILWEEAEHQPVEVSKPAELL